MPVAERARALVLAYGWNATVYQTLNRGIAHWYAEAGDAFVGYVARAGVRVVAGAPVCAESRLAEVAFEFERDAARAGEHVCYFAAGDRLERVRRAMSTSAQVVLGAQPVWRPAALTQIISRRATLRAQINRARNKGLVVREWPAALDPADRAPLERMLEYWLSTRGLPPLHFLVEPWTLDRLGDRRLFVAERAGTPVGFLVAAPVPLRNGWLIEQCVRGRGAPNGTTESLIAHVAAVTAAEGSDYLTLGLSPLSRRAGAPTPATALWLRVMLAWIRAHGRRFYNFDGLDAFKAKFRPEHWEWIFALSNEPRVSPRTLYAVAAAFSAGRPEWTIARALARAVKEEARRAVPDRNAVV
jgi:phosphatidylglycerol lysyltransferase